MIPWWGILIWMLCIGVGAFLISFKMSATRWPWQPGRKARLAVRAKELENERREVEAEVRALRDANISPFDHEFEMHARYYGIWGHMRCRTCGRSKHPEQFLISEDEIAALI